MKYTRSFFACGLFCMAFFIILALKVPALAEETVSQESAAVSQTQESVKRRRRLLPRRFSRNPRRRRRSRFRLRRQLLRFLLRRSWNQNRLSLLLCLLRSPGLSNRRQLRQSSKSGLPRLRSVWKRILLQKRLPQKFLPKKAPCGLRRG